MKESFQRIIAWAKQHPWLAAAIVGGVILLAYFAYKRGAGGGGAGGGGAGGEGEGTPSPFSSPGPPSAGESISGAPTPATPAPTFEMPREAPRLWEPRIRPERDEPELWEPRIRPERDEPEREEGEHREPTDLLEPPDITSPVVVPPAIPSQSAAKRLAQGLKPKIGGKRKLPQKLKPYPKKPVIGGKRKLPETLKPIPQKPKPGGRRKLPTSPMGRPTLPGKRKPSIKGKTPPPPNFTGWYNGVYYYKGTPSTPRRGR